MGAHAKWSPSGAEKWWNCPASVAMEEGLPDTPSVYSDEGTAAHFLGSECLTHNVMPSHYQGRTIACWEQGDEEGACFLEELENCPGAEIRSSFGVTPEMVGFITSYVEKVREYAEGGMLFVEQRLPIDHVTGEEGAAGTTDAMILKGDLLIIDDLKYGRGEAVSPVENKQLMMYASAALEWLAIAGESPGRVKLVIHQPRVQSDPLEWDCTTEEIFDFVNAAKGRVTSSRIALEFKDNWFGKSNTYYVPTEGGCRWCKAKPTCPGAAEKVQEVLEASFEKLAELPEGTATAVVTRISTSGLALGQKMAAVGMIEDWCKAVRAEVERSLLADPASVPGYKIVQGKKGHRKWVDEKAAEEEMRTMRIKHDLMYDYALISPTQAEKVFKAGGIGPRQWPKLKAMYAQTEGKPSVAPDSDSRPALPGVADSFDVLPPDDGSDLG